MRQRRVVVLCDNESATPGIGCEWGLALAVDLGSPPASQGCGRCARCGSDPDEAEQGGIWLWDTGQTDLFLKNASALGVDVRTARGLALSHGHYDHTGGISALLAAGFEGDIYAHPACALDRYAKEKGKARHIGPPMPLPQFRPAGLLTPLAPGLSLLADISREPGRCEAVQGFSLDTAGKEPDAVADDAFLLLETSCGPVVILGCCHSGLANSLHTLRQRTGLLQVHAVLGGLHLFKADALAIEETAQALEDFGVRELIAGHCTGNDRIAALRDRLGDCQVHPLAAGQTWVF